MTRNKIGCFWGEGMQEVSASVPRFYSHRLIRIFLTFVKTWSVGRRCFQQPHANHTQCPLLCFKGSSDPFPSAKTVPPLVKKTANWSLWLSSLHHCNSRAGHAAYTSVASYQDKSQWLAALWVAETGRLNSRHKQWDPFQRMLWSGARRQPPERD